MWCLGVSVEYISSVCVWCEVYVYVCRVSVAMCVVCVYMCVVYECHVWYVYVCGVYVVCVECV